MSRNSATSPTAGDGASPAEASANAPAATSGATRDRHGGAHLGYGYLHTALDDHSRLAYTEILTDERKETAVAFWQRAHAYFSGRGITVRRVLTDNGACYKSFAWRDALTAVGITHKRTRPYRPQTNGKVERFHRTLADEWAYTRPYHSETERRAALAPWLHMYNHHRNHTALGGLPPTTAHQPHGSVHLGPVLKARCARLFLSSFVCVRIS